MDFLETAKARQSCRRFDPERGIEQEKLDAILCAARLAPSACNGQPYLLTLCLGKTAKAVAGATQEMGMNRFASDAAAMLVISEKPYVKSAAVGAKLKGNDYRSIDIGIAAAYITAEAASLGLGSCILGWLNAEKLGEVCGLDGRARLVIALGYPREGDPLREKKRKELNELVKVMDQ